MNRVNVFVYLLPVVLTCL